MVVESITLSEQAHENARIEATALELQKPETMVALGLENRECPVKHHFAPGVYLRTITMPAGTFVIGAEHKTEHFNIVQRGRARVMMNGKVRVIAAPAMFVSAPGVRKVLFIEETMEWTTVHANPEDARTLNALEDLCIVKTPSYDQMKEIDAMKRKMREDSLEVGRIGGAL